MGNKGNVFVIFLVVAAIAMSGVIGFWWKQKYAIVQAPTTAPAEQKKNPQSPDETTSWKTFVNKTSGYVLNYPSTWQAKDYTSEAKGPEGKYASNVETLVGLDPLNSVSNRERPDKRAIEILVETRSYDSFLLLIRGFEGGLNVDRKETDLMILGYPAKRITGRTVLDGAMAGYKKIDFQTVLVIIDRSGKPYTLSTSPSYVEIFDQILSTFKFL